ncbi:hypothetical protein GLAREA_09730 [Glarea lozoyensis ATCC 20868]|uniref:Uncharacterized protein n=1 Tax=Glarea lozoyensis (strain ATCC 20868 / MF5171) TaxID=1116229 RepID=S3CUB7_GLAL2|nr:uncharacterized protein GLAREA_09730 [Glarea lozoyensis ATCC 20868]EPE28609.1 hypothetical protein GLAREA_09730 [Glarea lozoyensis ATCC 20868]
MTLKDEQTEEWNTASMEEIKFLICVLRLRCQPPVPYPHIESYLNQIMGLSHEKLSDIFDREEREETNLWEDAKTCDDWNVERILIISGVDREGYRLAERKETDAQIKWRRTKDWKVGSLLMKPDEVSRVM